MIKNAFEVLAYHTVPTSTSAKWPQSVNFGSDVLLGSWGETGAIIIPKKEKLCGWWTAAVLTICHTCMMLSSDTEQMTQGSLGFQEKSEILAVWPPWMNWWGKKVEIRHNNNKQDFRNMDKPYKCERSGLWNSLVTPCLNCVLNGCPITLYPLLVVFKCRKVYWLLTTVKI